MQLLPCLFLVILKDQTNSQHFQESLFWLIGDNCRLKGLFLGTHSHYEVSVWPDSLSMAWIPSLIGLGELRPRALFWPSEVYIFLIQEIVYQTLCSALILQEAPSFLFDYGPGCECLSLSATDYFLVILDRPSRVIWFISCYHSTAKGFS